MSQYDAREVADLLSRFDFKILSEQERDFSPSHRKYLCEFSRPGYETFSTKKLPRARLTVMPRTSPTSPSASTACISCRPVAPTASTVA